MDVIRKGSGGAWEERVGYSRVVRGGANVWVSGCTGVDADGNLVAGGAGPEAAQALKNVAAALEQVGASINDVVRTRIYLTRMEDWETVGVVHGEVFADARPATTMLGVAALIDPAMSVEIEVDAYVTD